MITEQDIEMLPIFSPDARNLLEGFLDRNPKLRLGAARDGIDQIKNHAFFASVDWEALYRREI